MKIVLIVLLSLVVILGYWVYLDVKEIRKLRRQLQVNESRCEHEKEKE